MATPTYQGTKQSSASGGGIFDSLGIFGDSAPAYVGNGQPSSASSGGILGGLFGSSTPAYRPAPAPSKSTNAASSDFDPDPFGSGPIAIVIPRQG